MTDLSRNVVILPLDANGEISTQLSEFCLDVALHRDGYIDEIWLLSHGKLPIETDRARFSRWGNDLSVRNVHLDPKIWPMDEGNNLYLRAPLSVYSALRGQDLPQNIYMPLHGAGAYFALQAQKGGLVSKDTKFITTCYLPKRLELSGGLTLPQHIKNVVDCELEEFCAKFSHELWISHPALSDALSKIFRLPNKDHIFSLPLKSTSAPAKPKGRHIIFAGQALPLYGFDAFCDLAEQLEDELDAVTVCLHSTHNNEALKWAKTTQKRLRKLNVTLDWRDGANAVSSLDSLETGVFISLIRAPILPAEARAAIGAGLTTLWGTGFDIHLPEIKSQGLYPVLSDTRKASEALRVLWGDTEPTRQKPLSLTPLKKAARKTLSPKPLPPIKLLSVIITHHNRPEFLDQCLTSLKQQTESDFEVIIVDDGSQLELLEQVESLVAKSSFKSIELSKIENSYPAAARNHGAKLARGDALFFVDDDNILDPRTISALRKGIANHDLALSFFQTFEDKLPAFETYEDNQGLAELQGPAYGFAGLLPGCGLFHNLTGNASVMIRRTAFETLGGFSAKFGIGLEDYALMLKGAFRGDLNWVVLPEPYLSFRLHKEKIRNTHVDWTSPVRLQAGHWRILEDLDQENSALSSATLAYARQLHELTQYTFIAPERPKYFRLRSIVLHQYFRPFLSQFVKLRRSVVKFTSRESRFAKKLEKWFF